MQLRGKLKIVKIWGLCPNAESGAPNLHFASTEQTKIMLKDYIQTIMNLFSIFLFLRQ